MIDIIKAKINELELRKTLIRNKVYTSYEFIGHFDIYLELKNIDHSLEVLRDIQIKVLENK